MSDVTEIMLRRFTMIFGEPDTADMAGLVAEYERALNGTSREVLHKATDWLVDNQQGRYWPTPGRCRDAVSRCAEYVAPAYPDARKDDAWPAPTEESKARVRALVAEMKRNMATNRIDEDKPSKLPDVSRDGWAAWRRNTTPTRASLRRRADLDD